MINWRKTAEQNGLTPEEFEREIMMAACAMATMKIDKRSDSQANCFKFTSSDQVGKIELYVRRVHE